jgi:hypothetical protein
MQGQILTNTLEPLDLHLKGPIIDVVRQQDRRPSHNRLHSCLYFRTMRPFTMPIQTRPVSYQCLLSCADETPSPAVEIAGGVEGNAPPRRQRSSTVLSSGVCVIFP